MAPNSLSPASVVIDYHGPFSAHKMTIPTREWFPTSITGDLGSYQAWDTTTVDAEEMITDLLTQLKKFLHGDAAFDAITIYTQATATSPNIPRVTKAIAIAGTAIDTAQTAAVSATWNFKTTLNGNMKLILLDTPIRDTWFYKINAAAFSTDQALVANEIVLASHAWSGRDDGEPLTCRNITYDLNDKLQRQYFR